MITIDTENHLNTDFNMMECDFGDAGICGIRYIMDQLEKRGMRGVFFVDIYAHRQFHGPQADAVESAVRQIHARGHEVGLHAHRDSELPFYKKHLMDCGYQEQRTVYEYGVRFIREITGNPPVSFRGGHYACNEDTFRALSDTGFQVDSSIRRIARIPSCE